MDVERFWQLMIDAIHAADLASPLNPGAAAAAAVERMSLQPHSNAE